MADKDRVDTGEGTGMEDARENQNEEFGRGDQEFGGGSGEAEYGDGPRRVGQDGAVYEGQLAEEAVQAAEPREAATTETEGWEDPDEVAADESRDKGFHAGSSSQQQGSP